MQGPRISDSGAAYRSGAGPTAGLAASAAAKLGAGVDLSLKTVFAGFIRPLNLSQLPSLPFSARRSENRFRATRASRFQPLTDVRGSDFTARAPQTALLKNSGTLAHLPDVQPSLRLARCRDIILPPASRADFLNHVLCASSVKCCRECDTYGAAGVKSRLVNLSPLVNLRKLLWTYGDGWEDAWPASPSSAVVTG